MYKTFETERLIIQPTTRDDADLILQLFNMPKWLLFIGDRNIHTLDDARHYIETKMLPQLERLGYSNYTIVRKSDKAKIGICGLFDREGLEGIDIGFAVLPDYEGNGYAYEAASNLLHAAFDEFGLHEVLAITHKDNLPSQKLLEKLGMTCTGLTRLTNEDEDLLRYRIKKEIL